MVLAGHGIIQQHVAPRTEHHLRAHLLPALTRGEALVLKKIADTLLALLLAVPTLSIAQQMLGYAGWYDGPSGYRTIMLYVPWHLNLFLGPAYYLYFRSLPNQEFRLWPRAW